MRSLAWLCQRFRQTCKQRVGVRDLPLYGDIIKIDASITEIECFLPIFNTSISRSTPAVHFI